uniref:Uncharacterized protein n=1 Tax=Siphoviridae sp. ctqSm5 TaxID=2827949 RepID=A0A8S5SNX7_9CAUD|nr:MAG TPA: hypothetical protein [Siphoviridae sp. ctqSm5]
MYGHSIEWLFYLSNFKIGSWYGYSSQAKIPSLSFFSFSLKSLSLTTGLDLNIHTNFLLEKFERGEI